MLDAKAQCAHAIRKPRQIGTTQRKKCEFKSMADDQFQTGDRQATAADQSAIGLAQTVAQRLDKRHPIQESLARIASMNAGVRGGRRWILTDWYVRVARAVHRLLWMNWNTIGCFPKSKCVCRKKGEIMLQQKC